MVESFKDFRTALRKAQSRIAREAFSYTDKAPGDDHCKICHYGGRPDSTCALYIALNKAKPDDFKLDENIEPTGYCKAFREK